MAGTANHDYHILEPDIWPLVGSISALTFTSGMVLFMHRESMGGWPIVLGLGIAGLIATFFAWFSNIVQEAQAGDHTPVVQLHLRYGMILFIASEVMFFVGWFWAFFDFALFPSELSEAIGGQFPPKGMEVLDAFDLPLLNTLILLCSGTTVTWAHHSLIHGDRDGLKKGLGMVPNLYATLALSDTALDSYLQFQNAKSSLSSKAREVVNLVVSQVNRCDYCLAAHTAIGAMVGLKPDQIMAIRHGGAPFDARLDALARLVKNIAVERGHADPALVQAFFDAGWTQENLVDAIVVIAHTHAPLIGLSTQVGVSRNAGNQTVTCGVQHFDGVARGHNHLVQNAFGHGVEA